MEVRPCPHGRGLFALRDLVEGTVIFDMDDLVLTANPTSPPEWSRALRVGENEYWDEDPLGSPYYWTNFIDHSSRPNTEFRFDRDKRRARYVVLRPIKKDEELFIKYDDYHPANPTWPS